MKKYLRIVLIIISAFAIFLLGAYMSQEYFLTSIQKSEIIPSFDEKSNSISLMIDFGDGNIETIHDINVKRSDNLLLILKELENTKDQIRDIKIQDYGEMGVLITSINDFTNGQNNNYWQYYVNNKQPMLSIDKYILSNKDVVELKFTKSKF
ncbi:MAG: DUF4430 domain-containing protein [Patescibacteria group bacterium]|nr:DUF4430 domain-containing protein [Patescibacteria group bacterium]MDD4304098.1 DUF4430 domain-containing protein [Patescibacteria group bacterium]MDD4694975.1 DUF4430 domain-containing protein [Patescibacteria group bacterium]